MIDVPSPAEQTLFQQIRHSVSTDAKSSLTTEKRGLAMAQKILVIMAVFRPEPEHLRIQIESISRQTHRNLVVHFVVADTTSQQLITRLATSAGLEHSIAVPTTRLDAVRAFEFGLASGLAAHPEIDYIALSDQDDFWHPDRLECGLHALISSGADLVHSDARVIGDDGSLLHPSLFRLERRCRAPGLRGLLYRNNVTGMTTLFSRQLADRAIPFPAQDGLHFYHDLWLALVAEATSRVQFVDRQLVDYRQHDRNAVGALKPGMRRPSLRQLAGSYALAMYLARALVLRFEANEGCRGKLQKLKPFLGRLSLGRQFLVDALRLALALRPGPALQALTFACAASGRSIWALRRAFGQGLESALCAFDDRIYAISPGQRPAPAPGNDPAASSGVANWTQKAGRRMALDLGMIRSDRPATLNILVPSLNPTEIFAGIATAIDIGLGIAARGRRVRFIATDLPIASESASRAFLLQRMPGEDPGEAVMRVEILSAHSHADLPCQPHDRFLATAWWTAHMAQRLIGQGQFANREFYYLIQDFEPNFYPWGAEFSGAIDSYQLDFVPIFNTELLRRYFDGQGFAFAGRQARCFRPSIDLDVYTRLGRSHGPGKKRIAIYGRPEVDRNMFPLAIEALAGFLEREAIDKSLVHVCSVGLRHEDILLPNGIRMESLGKIPWSDYPGFLSKVDLGLSLMYSPHPSHVPLEMAAAGARVVTNRFGPKDLSSLSPAILSCDPTASNIANALSLAWHMPNPTMPDRLIDLSQLGATLEATINALAHELGTSKLHLDSAA